MKNNTESPEIKKENNIKTSLGYLLVPIIGWLIFVMVCSPLREAIIDDDFSTVWEVKNYLASGQYTQSQWTAPFTLPQVIYGSEIAKALEDFLPIEIALRLSSLFFSIIGVLSLFFLSRQSGLNLKTASICSLQIVASSIYTYLSYLFYSDIPFLSMSLLSLSLYTHGFSKNKPQFILFASIFASGSVLLRQTGITITVTLIAFLIFSKNRKSNFIVSILGLLPPLICTFLIINFQLSVSTFAGILHNQAQAEYLHSAERIIFSSFERMSLLPIMMTLLSAPLSFIGAFYLVQYFIVFKAKFNSQRKSTLIKRIIYLFFPSFLSLSLTLTVVFKRIFNQDSPFLPYLPWYYSYNFLPYIMRNSIFSLVTLCSSSLLLFLFLFTMNHKLKLNHKVFILARKLQSFSLIDWFTLFNILLLMMIFKTGDKYWIMLLPWFLIWICSILQRYIEKYFIPIVSILIIVTIGNAIVLDRAYSIMEAEFKSVKLLENSGISHKDIWYGMAGYYSFEDYVKIVGFVPPNIEKGMYYDFFFRWCPDIKKQAKYEIIRVPENQLTAINGEVKNEISVKDWTGKITRVITIKK